MDKRQNTRIITSHYKELKMPTDISVVMTMSYFLILVIYILVTELEVNEICMASMDYLLPTYYLKIILYFLGILLFCLRSRDNLFI